MDKLRVCLANDSFPPLIDGVATAVVNYAENINRRLGYATVVTPDYPGADDSQYDFPVIRYLSIDFTKFVGYRAGVPFSAELLQRLQAEDFQIIHSHCPITSTILARILRKRADIPIVCTYHTKFDIDIAKAIRGKILQEEAVRLLVKNISACDEVWTVSEGAGKNLQALGFTGEYVVMPNGVDFPVGRCSQAQIGEVTKGFDLPSDIPVFLFVGRMMWYKGIRIILDALARLSAQGIDFRMVFIGDGKDRKEIVDYAQLLPCSGKVLFLPPIHDREHIRAWYCRADLFLFPSTFDTNGLVVREAAACGLASVLIEIAAPQKASCTIVTGFSCRKTPRRWPMSFSGFYRRCNCCIAWANVPSAKSISPGQTRWRVLTSVILPLLTTTASNANPGPSKCRKTLRARPLFLPLFKTGCGKAAGILDALFLLRSALQSSAVAIKKND